MGSQQRDQPHAREVGRPAAPAHVRTPRRSTTGHVRCQLLRRARSARKPELTQFDARGSSAASTAATADSAAAAAATVEVLEHPFVSWRQPEVVHPAPQQRVQRPRSCGKRSAAPCRSSSRMRSLSRCTLCWRDPQAALAMRGDAVAQELALPRPRHRALRRVDLQPQDLRSRNALTQPITRSPAAATAHVDVAVVGVAARTRGPVAPAPCPARRAGCWTAAATAARLAACPPSAAATTPLSIIPACR